MEVRIEGEAATLVLPDQPLGSGTQGSAYPHPALANRAVKIWEQALRNIPKLDAFLASPPAIQNKSVRIARPLRRVLSVPGDHPIGFTMERASGIPLADLLNPLSRPPSVQAIERRLEIMLKLADAVEQLHADGSFLIFDGLAPQNVLVGSEVTLIDVDGWAIHGPDGVYHPADFVHDDICPPECIDKDVGTLTLGKEADRWILSTLVFWSVTGCHPFLAVCTSLEHADIQSRIADGLWPYTARARRRGIRPHPDAPLSLFHPSMRKLVNACFDRGSLKPSARPTPDCWRKAIAQALNDKGYLTKVRRVEKSIADRQAAARATSTSSFQNPTRPSPRQWQSSRFWSRLVFVSVAVMIIAVASIATFNSFSVDEPPRLAPSSDPPYFGPPRPTPKGWRKMATTPVPQPQRTPIAPSSDANSAAWKRLQDLSD